MFEESFVSGANQQLLQEIEFLEKQITDIRDEDERLSLPGLYGKGIR
jgi:hypothetical protein